MNSRVHSGWPLVLIALTMLCAAGAVSSHVMAQNTGNREIWFELAARAERILSCETIDTGKISKPLEQARALFQEALQSVDRAPSTNADGLRLRGVFRAEAIRRVDQLNSRILDWKESLEKATRLKNNSFLTRAQAVIAETEALQCAEDFGRLSGEISLDLRRASQLLDAADISYAAASSSLNARRALSKAREAKTNYEQAWRINREDARASDGIRSAQTIIDNLGRISKNEILILTNPGGASVRLVSGHSYPQCTATPCKWAFDSAFFERSGGNFVDSKRLIRQVVAQITKEGYKSESIVLTSGPRTWEASIPGGRFRQIYYFFEKREFFVTLKPDSAATTTMPER